MTVLKNYIVISVIIIIIMRNFYSYCYQCYNNLVNALVFLFESVPGIHNIDYDKLYEDWLLYLNDVTLKRSDTGMVVTNTIADGSKGIRRLKKEDDKKDETRFIYNKQFMHLLNTSRTKN